MSLKFSFQLKVSTFFSSKALQEQCPDCALQEQCPDCALQEQCPGCALQEQCPDCALQGQCPDCALQEQCPDCTPKRAFGYICSSHYIAIPTQL